LRILRIFHGGGVPAYQRRDEEISALGHEVHLLTPKTFRELPTITYSEIRSDVIRVTPIGLYGIKQNPLFFYNPIRLAHIFRGFKPHVLDMHEEPYSLAAASVLVGRWVSGVKCKVVFRSSQNELKSYPFPFSAVQKWVFKTSAEAYVPSAQASEVLRQKGFDKGITVVGNGVAVPDEPLTEARSSSKLEVVCVGRLIERKGVQDLVEAVVSSNVPINLTIVGSGPMEEQLRRLSEASLSTSAKVVFKGAVSIEEAAEIMCQSDVICVPSHELDGWSEQFSRALVEGMANFCVPLVSSSGALPEIAGGITPPFRWGDIQELTHGLEALANSGDLQGLKRLAHEHAVRNYSWQATSRSILAIYERVA
jgi:glycosyltransferase involved in cell wall biosynthesis